ncbi:MAG: hypothetical protein ACMG57_00025 [Candidatus Dojkabacteria bacterium]
MQVNAQNNTATPTPLAVMGNAATPTFTPTPDCNDPQTGELFRGAGGQRLVDWINANGGWGYEFALDRADRTLGNALSWVQDQYHTATGGWMQDKVITVSVINAHDSRFAFLPVMSNLEGFGLVGMPLTSGDKAHTDAEWRVLDGYTMQGTGGEKGLTVGVWDAQSLSDMGGWIMDRLTAGCGKQWK